MSTVTLLDRTTTLRKPAWIRVKAPSSAGYHDTRKLMREKGLHTVCEEAACPNIGECWTQKHATVMILGDTCTRACAFCNVKTGMPLAVDPKEPAHLAEVVATMGLAHVVITSVDRDDLPDGGAFQFVRCIEAIRAARPETTIEILTPDFLRKPRAVEAIVAARPDVYNHNLETVPRLYRTVRPGARYFHSLRLLQQVKELDPSLFTKSGIMVGLGEEKREVLQVMDDMRSADIDFLTIGQYLQPTPRHHKVLRFVEPDEFDGYARSARAKGFLQVAASPLTRSSYHAGDDFAQLRARPGCSSRQRRCSGFGFGGCRRTLRNGCCPIGRSSSTSWWPASTAIPEFLPWCKAARITRREGDVFYADLVIAFKVFRERFSSKVTLHPTVRCRRRVHQWPVPLPQQPLAFRAGPGGLSASISTSTSSSSSKLLQNLIGLLFNEAVHRMVAAFETRAHKLYTPVATESARAEQLIGKPAIG